MCFHTAIFGTALISSKYHTLLAVTPTQISSEVLGQHEHNFSTTKTISLNFQIF